MSNDRQRAELAEAEASRLREALHAIFLRANLDALWQTSIDTGHSRRFIMDKCQEAQ